MKMLIIRNKKLKVENKIMKLWLIIIQIHRN